MLVLTLAESLLALCLEDSIHTSIGVCNADIARFIAFHKLALLVGRPCKPNRVARIDTAFARWIHTKIYRRIASALVFLG